MGKCCSRGAAAQDAGNASSGTSRPNRVLSKQQRKVLIKRGAKTKFVALEDCKLKTVPNELYELGGLLQKLSLKNNSFEGAFPLGHMLNSLPALRKLNLAGNAIDSIEGCEGTTKAQSEVDGGGSSIQALNLSRNAFEHVAVLVLPSLIELDLKHNKIVVLAGLQCNNLQVLDLAFNCIKELSDAMADALKEMKSLRTLKLNNNELKSLPDIFAGMQALSLVDVSHNQLTRLPVSLLRDSAVATITLDDNPFCEGEAYYRFEGFKDYEARGKARADKGVHAGLAVNTI